MTTPTHFQRGPSINSGTSKTQNLSPPTQFLTTSMNMAQRTAGCTIEFSFLRFASSLKMIDPSFFRSNDPSGCRTSGPKNCTIFFNAGVPGSTTCLAKTSASTTLMSLAFMRRDTEDLPVAIPPVRPTTERQVISPVEQRDTSTSYPA